MTRLAEIDWVAWLATLVLIVVFRETAVWLCSQLGWPELGNLAGLIALLSALLIYKRVKFLPQRLLDVNNKIMKESAFAFLPICAGALVMLFEIGAELPLFLVVLVVSTLIPLWLYATLAKKWL